jgi:hypothetical protein
MCNGSFAYALQAMYLHSHVMSWRDQLLSCSIDHLIRNIAPSTPLDVFVFVRSEVADTMAAELAQQLGPNMDRVCLLPITPEQWSHQQPRAAPYQLPNNTNRYRDYLIMVRNTDGCVRVVKSGKLATDVPPSTITSALPRHYVMQGQWRLLVPNQVMYSLGYPYTVQVDDDLFVTEPFEVRAWVCLPHVALHPAASHAWVKRTLLTLRMMLHHAGEHCAAHAVLQQAHWHTPNQSRQRVSSISLWLDRSYQS